VLARSSGYGSAWDLALPGLRAGSYLLSLDAGGKPSIRMVAILLGK
jgi:hypothetical protein